MTTRIHTGLVPAARVLTNGAKVLVSQSRTTPVVTISAAYHAGSLYDPDDQPGLAYFLSCVIDRGNAQRSAAEIAEELDVRGVSLRVHVTRHALMLSCDCLAEDFEDVLSSPGRHHPAADLPRDRDRNTPRRDPDRDSTG